MNVSFPVIRLWESADRIRSGELPELAPLLVLCDKVPTIATVREEVALIHASRLPVETQAELLGLALLVATRQFTRELLLHIFQEDWSMIEGLEILDDLNKATGKIDRWLAKGEAKGEMNGSRATLLRLGRKRFGEPAADAPQALEMISSTEEIQQLAERLLEVESWKELLG